MTTVFHVRMYGTFTEIQSSLRRKKLHRMNFLLGSFSNRDNARVPIQFRRKRRHQHLKRWIFLKNRPIHFHINSTSVIRPAKQNKTIWVFPALKSTSHFLHQSTCPPVQVQKPILDVTTGQMSITLGVESSTISIDSNIIDNTEVKTRVGKICWLSHWKIPKTSEPEKSSLPELFFQNL